MNDVLNVTRSNYSNNFQQGASLPLVTIGMPIFNGAVYLPRAIESILQQTYPNIEIIISDNFSTDGTQNIISQLRERIPGVVVHNQPRNMGVVENFKTVLRLASGEYFVWFAPDDLMHPNFLEVLVQELERHPKATACMTQTNRIQEKDSVLFQVNYPGSANPNEISIVRQCALTLSRKVENRQLYYNMFISGLFRRSFLSKLVGKFPDIFQLGERPLVGLAALSGGLRYVDKPYFTKILKEIKFAKTHADDPYIKSFPRSNWRQLVLISKWIMLSPTVSTKLKIEAVLFVIAPLFWNDALRFVANLK
jgi:glycosyltransferase involved in cell wall biosynthesis